MLTERSSIVGVTVALHSSEIFFWVVVAECDSSSIVPYITAQGIRHFAFHDERYSLSELCNSFLGRKLPRLQPDVAGCSCLPRR